MDTFEAFISYRHVPKDKRWAIWLHRSLERYRTPKSLQASGIRSRTGRIFRDEDELPASSDLNEVIRDALKRSKHLIVVCSRSTPSSRWVNAEIEYFAGLGRAKSIFVLLIDGEAQDAFPQSLKVLGLEPLAGDVRPGTKAPRKKRQIALLKLLAGIFGCGYDDLFQRERQRFVRRRRYLVFASIALVSSLIVGSWYTIRSRIQELSTYSDQNLGSDPSLSVLLSRAAFESSRWWLNLGHDIARPALERALIASPLRDEFDAHDIWIRGLAWSPTGLIVAGGSYGHLTAWDRRTRKQTSTGQVQQGVQRLVFGLSVDPLVALAGDHRVVSVWDPRRSGLWNLRDFYQGLNYQMSDVSWCSVSHRLATSYGTEVAIVFQPEKQDSNKQLKQPEWVYVNSVAWSPNCDRLAIGTLAGLYVWSADTDRFERLASEKAHTVNAGQIRPEGVLRVAWSPDGSKVATCGDDGTVRVWQLDQPGDPDVLSGHRGVVNDVAWSPDGARLASASSDSTIIVWQKPALSELYEPHVIHTGQKTVFSLAWSPDGTEIASGGDERGVRIWRVATASEEVELSGDRWTLSVDDDDELIIGNRRLTDTELLELARQRTARPFSKDECAKYFRIGLCPSFQP